jgi:hypothetical protein
VFFCVAARQFALVANGVGLGVAAIVAGKPQIANKVRYYFVAVFSSKAPLFSAREMKFQAGNQQQTTSVSPPDDTSE